MNRLLIVVATFVTGSWAAEVCCPNLDTCFSDTGAWSGPIPLPECQTSIGITHEVFTRANRLVGQAITRTNVPSVWQGSKESVFLIHGWNNNKDTQWLIDAKNAILDRDDKNVIITGWGPGANRANYAQSAANTRVVGAETRAIIEILKSRGGSQFYCVGHSLGAHSCGNVGTYEGLRGVNRITGLDPAGPLFGDADPMRGLNVNSAQAVEAWHTDGKDSINSYGTLTPMGQRDFYPAEGGLQPGCNSFYEGFAAQVENPDLKDDPLIACSHGRATKYFIQSVKSDCFKVRQICTNENNIPGSCSSCSNCPSMGYVRNSGQDGKYNLGIDAAEPHCQN
jgi:pancreatic triacylglycerol lipase